MTTSVSKQKSNHRTIAYLTVLMTSAISASAFAASPVTWTREGAPTVAVQYDDLDLATEQGTKMLYARIASAARQVCPDEHVRDLSLVAASQACQADAVSRAVQSLNNPQLALVHAARTRHG